RQPAANHALPVVQPGGKIRRIRARLGVGARSRTRLAPTAGSRRGHGRPAPCTGAIHTDAKCFSRTGIYHAGAVPPGTSGTSAARPRDRRNRQLLYRLSVEERTLTGPAA